MKPNLRYAAESQAGSRRAVRGTPEFGLISRLALADLWHERLLSFCLVAALTAVLAPLLVLLGLRYGLVHTLRDRLVNDPRNREMRPVSSSSFDARWVQKMASRPEVAFLTPMTRQISASVRIQALPGPGQPAGDDSVKLDADILATGPGDVLLTENGGKVPKEGECTLTAELAKSLSLTEKSYVRLIASRSTRGKLEWVSRELQVVSVLQPRASSLKAVFVSLKFLDAVETYKDGVAVSDYGWPGGIPAAQPVYDAAFFAVPGGLTTLEESELRVTSGFDSLRRVTATELPKMEPPFDGKDLVYYRAATGEGNTAITVEFSSLVGLRRQLPRTASRIYGWVRPLLLEVQDENGTKIGSLEADSLTVPVEDGTNAVSANSSPKTTHEATEPPNAPISSDAPSNVKDPLEARVTLYAPSELEPVFGAKISLSYRGAHGALVMPALCQPTSEVHKGLLLSSVAGLFRLSDERQLTWDKTAGKPVLARISYAGFRLYARSIDDVERLVAVLADQGISVFTKAERIRDVKELDRYTSFIFWLIASLGLLGCAGALIASLYAAVERKRRTLATLRLLGLSRLRLARLPFFQAAFLVTCAVGLSVGIYFGMADVINTFSSRYLETGERLAMLPDLYFAAVWLGALLLAGLASCLAAMRVFSIHPSEALRDE
jgi:putative ABC transport system permease protein